MKRRLKEACYRLLPLVYAGNSCKLFLKDTILLPPLLNYSRKSFPDTNTKCEYRCHLNHRYSTISEVVAEPLVQLDLPTFIKSAIDKPEGPSLFWLNGTPKKIFLKDGVILVLVAGFMDGSSVAEADFVGMLEKVKFLQQRYPSLQIFGFQCTKIHLSSSDTCTHLLRRTMREYFAFPILLANKDVLEIASEACYVIFKDFKSPPFYYGKEADMVILDKAIKEFRAQESDTPKSIMHNLTSSWIKPTIDFKEPPLCVPLQNLLLYFPGGISVDESGNRVFLSDSNHHRVIVLDDNGTILDSIGSSPGHEDGEFEYAKLKRPAASFYNAADDCLYLVDSENHAIRRADMRRRVVETLYPRSKTNKDSSILTWIFGKLWPINDADAQSEELNQDTLLFPWHVLKSPNGDLLILNHSCESLWIMDLASGVMREVVKGFSNILEICEPLIREKSVLLNQMPNDWLQQQVGARYSNRIPYVELMSSVATFRDQILICDTVGQTLLRLDRNSSSLSSFRFSNLGILGFPYWSSSPLERVCAGDGALPASFSDYVESFNLLPGRVDIRLKLDIPEYVDLIEPLSEGCIWRQTRGAATEISEADSTIPSLEEVGVAQQWYDEIDSLAFSTPEIESSTEEGATSHGEEIPEGRVEISCSINTCPGTSEVIICAALYLRLKKDSDGLSVSRQKKAGRLADVLNPGKRESTDEIVELLLTSNRDLEEVVLTRPIRVRLKFDCPNHPKADNSKDIILTDTSLSVNVNL